MKKFLLSVIAALAISPMASALPLTKTAPNAYTGDLINETGLAHSTSFTLDLGQYAANRISAVMTYSTNSFAAGTFTSGSTSSGTVTVLSTTGLSGLPLSIGGVTITAGTDYPVGADVNTTALYLSQVIDCSTSPFKYLVTAATAGATVGLTSVYIGGNYAMHSGNAAVLEISTAMGLGTGASYNAVTDVIQIASHGFTPGLPVLYTIGTVAISGLTNATTYYASVIDADHIYLATTSALAVAGVYHVDITVQLASATARTYTLTPLKMEDSTAVVAWQASNDNSQYFAFVSSAATAASVTIASTTSSGYSYWDFGNVDFRYLRQLVTGPSTGGVVLRTIVHAKNEN